MASNYPTSLDTFAQPTDPSSAPLSSAGAGGNTRPHLEHHRDLGDVLEEVQKKLGLGAGKAVTNSFVAGLWNSEEGVTGGTQPAQDLLVLRRYEFPYGATITQLGIWCNAANTAGSVFRFGVYNDDGTGCYPGTLVIDAGVTTADLSTTGFKSCTAFSATDVGGIKWVGGAVQVAALIANGLIGFTSGGRGMAIATVPSSSAMQGYTNTGVTGALPGTFGSTRAVTNSGPRIFYK